MTLLQGNQNQRMQFVTKDYITGVGGNGIEWKVTPTLHCEPIPCVDI